MERTDQPYLFPEVQQSQPVIAVGGEQEREAELAPSRVLFHLFLLFVTAITTFLTGAIWSVEIRSEPESLTGAIVAPFAALVTETTSGNYQPLLKGMLFTFTLLIILGAHELGHYFACRYYRIRATLPYFIPAPPLLTPFGTFGAVIKIKEHIYSRRALFDIGIAGPLAGFVLALPASVIGLLIAEFATTTTTGEGIQFNDPLLFIIIMKIFGLPQLINWNPIYWASWATLLVTALNLFPVGQLDGGHVLYAVAGPRIHRWVSLIVALSVAALAVVSILMHGSPVWLLWSVVLFFLLKVGHPPVVVEEPLGRARIALAVIAIVVFLLCFMPFPITIS